MEQAEATEKIIDVLSKKKGKTKFYFSDLAKILGEKPRIAKKFIRSHLKIKILVQDQGGAEF